MGLISLPGRGIHYPPLPPASWWISTSFALTIDATGEKAAMMGTFYSPDRTAKTINTVGFQTGNITSAGGSTIRVSLQDISLTTGPPPQPDGTQDQYRDALLSTYTANSWFETGLVTSDGTDTGSKRTVAHGELLSVVVEYDSGGRLGSDSLIVASAVPWFTNSHRGGACSLFTASWALQNIIPSVLFTCSDGTVASFQLGIPYKTKNVQSYNVNSTPDECGLQFIAPFGGVVEGLWGLGYVGAGADFDAVLYENGLEIGAVAVDSNTCAMIGNHRHTEFLFANPVTLKKGSTYIISMRPTTTTSIAMSYVNVNAASHWAAHAGPVDAVYVSRTNGGAWSSTSTQRAVMGLMLSAIDDGEDNPRTRVLRSDVR